MSLLAIKSKSAILLMALFTAFTTVDASAQELQKRHSSNVLGTSFELVIDVSVAQAKTVEADVLAEVKRLERIFSSYDANSELSRLNALGYADGGQISADMAELIKQCQKWQNKQAKSFSCKLGLVIEKWRDLTEQQTRPVRSDIRALARAALESEYSLASLLAGEKNQDFKWNFGAIAKGYILDKAMAVAKASAGNATSIKLDIGGDAVYWTSATAEQQSWQVAIANPNALDDSGEQRLGAVQLQNGAIAYSGHSSRTYDIARRSYSHILVPRDGWPTHNPVTAVVTAPDATSADALATAFATSPISQSLDWLAKNPSYAALLIDNDGRQFASSNWYQNYTSVRDQGQKTESNTELKIAFSLPKIEVAKYRKPYVAIWVTDAKGKVVKNLMLLGQGENWMSEIRSWWRKQGRKSPHLLDGFARPTRRPGHYELMWDGRDDFGQMLAQGEYRLFAEAAREHGGYEKLSLSFQLGQQPQSLQRQGKKEIGSLSLSTAETKPN